MKILFKKWKTHEKIAFKSHDILYRANNHLTSPGGNTYGSQWCFTENVNIYIYISLLETRQGIIGSDKKESSGNIDSL